MRGRPKKPGHLRLIEGDTRNQGNKKHQEGLAAEPTGLFPMGSAPDRLDEAGLEVWKRVLDGLPPGMLCTIDSDLLETYCVAVSIFRQASKNLANSPLIVRGANGNIQQSPYITLVNTQSRLMHKLGSQLGLSPVARTNIHIPLAEQEPDPLDKYFH